MKTFKQFLTETVNPSYIHKGVTAKKLLALSKQHGTTRFVAHNNSIYAGDAHHLLHTDLNDAAGEDELSNAEGAISYNHETGKHHYYIDDFNKKHPIEDKLKKLGAIPGERTDDYENLSVQPIGYDRLSKPSSKSSIDRLYRELNEGFSQERIHKNPSINALKNLAMNSEHGIARTVMVPHSNTTYAADAGNFTHDDILSHKKLNADVSKKVQGYIYHNKGVFTHAHYYDSSMKPYNGPEIERLESKGGIGREEKPYDLSYGHYGKKGYHGIDRVCYGGTLYLKKDE
jgi:hypothetical protein